MASRPASRLTHNTLYRMRQSQPRKGQSASSKYSMPVPVREDEDTLEYHPNVTPHRDPIRVAASQTRKDFNTRWHNQNEDDEFNEEQAMARPDQGQEDDDLSPADRAQIEESARFEGPDGELLHRYERRLLGPEGTILINTDSTPLESWETSPMEARSLNRGVNGEQGKHRKVPLARERAEPVGEPLGRHRRRMLGPEGTILIREELTLPPDNGRPLHRADSAPKFRRVGFGPEGTELIET